MDDGSGFEREPDISRGVEQTIEGVSESRRTVRKIFRYRSLSLSPPFTMMVEVVDIKLNVCVCVCVFSSHPFWTSSSLDVPAGVTQEEGHTGFLIHLPSAVRALIFVARRIQPFLSLVDREVEFCVLTN